MVLTELRAVDVVDMEPAAIAAHAGLHAAWELLERSGCQFLPVVRDDRVVGVIEEHTLVAASREAACAGRQGRRRKPRRTLVVLAATPLTEVVAAVRRTPTEVTLVVDDEGGSSAPSRRATSSPFSTKRWRTMNDDRTPWTS